MDNIPQYVTDFLNNYYKLTKRLLSVVDLSAIILAEDISKDSPLFTEYNENKIDHIPPGTYMLNYETNTGETYQYWWRGNYSYTNLNRLMSTLLKSMDNTLEYYIGLYGYISYKHINVVNEFLDMSDEEFILYIKMTDIVHETNWRRTMY